MENLKHYFKAYYSRKATNLTFVLQHYLSRLPNLLKESHLLHH